MSPVLSEEAADLRLREWPVARLATLRADGQPHLVPVVFAYCDEAIWIPIDGKPKRDRRLERVRNLERDPRATLLVDAYDADWSALWWIHIEGIGNVRADDADARFERAARALTEKYPQYRDWPLFRGDPTLVEIAPQRRNTWCAVADGGRVGS